MDQPSGSAADRDLDSFLGVEQPHGGRRFVRRIAIGIAIVLVLLFVARCMSSAHEQPHYATQDVKRGDLPITVSGTGALASTGRSAAGLKAARATAEDASLKIDVKVDEADVGKLAVGNTASLTVEGYPGRAFPASVTRLDLGAQPTPTDRAPSVLSYIATLTVPNPDGALRPGMNAQAAILATVRRNVLIVPDAALFFTPGAPPMAPQQHGKDAANEAGQDAIGRIGRGSRQTVYVLDEKGNPRAIPVVFDDSNARLTSVTSTDLARGMKVITARLAKAGGH